MTLHHRPQVNITFDPGATEEVVPEAAPQLMPASRGLFIVQIVVLVLLCIGAAPAIVSSDFLPGDDAAVVSNPFLYQWGSIKDIWIKPQHLPQMSPLSYTVYLAEHQFAQHQPLEKRAREYRAISLLIHIGNVLLLMLLLRRLELPGAWLAAALFAVHPMQVDTVSWIAQQRYLVCAFFYLLALIVYLRRAGLNPVPPPPLPGTGPIINLTLPEGPKGLFALALALLVLALLSHVIAATFPLVVLIMIWWERGKVHRDDIVPLIPFAVLGLVMTIAQTWTTYRHDGHVWAEFASYRWIAYVGQGAWFYAIKTILPFGYSFAYPRWHVEAVALWKWLLPVGVIFVLFALAKLRKRWGRGPLATALLFLCLLIPAALGVNDSGGMDGVMVRDHALYFAGTAILVGFSALVVEWLATSAAAAKFVAMPGVVPAMSAIILIPLAILTADHAYAYHDPLSLWNNVLHGDGDSAVALNTMGKLEMKSNDFANAQRHFLAALADAPNETEALFNLASLAQAQGDLATALQRYYQILGANPDNQAAHFGLASVLAAQGQSEAALNEYDYCAKHDPSNPQIYNNVGLILAERGDSQGAIAQYRKAIKIDPRDSGAYINLANSLFREGSASKDPDFRNEKWKEAAEALKQVFRIDPRSYVARMNGGVMAASVNDLQSAENLFRGAISVKVDSADAWNNLGMVLMREGDLPGKMDHLLEAVYCFQHATELDPNNSGAARNLVVAQRRRDAMLAAQRSH